MMQIKLNEGTAARRRVPVALVDDSDGKSPETTVTLSAGDMKISKNGGAEANHGGTLTELAGGDYYYEFSAGEVDTVGYVTGRIVKSGVRTFRIAAQIVAFDPYDAVRQGLTALPNAAADAAGGLPISDAGGLDLDTRLNRLDVTVSTRLADADYTAPLDAAGVRAALGMAAADLDAQMDALADLIDALYDDIFVTNRNEPGQGTPGASIPFAEKLDHLYKHLRNRKTNDGTTTNLYNAAGTVVDHKQTTSEAAGTVEKSTWTSGP